MDLDRYRKDAKRLVRGMQTGDPEARGRAEEVLGARARELFQLSDALHVIAVERGYRSWPEMKRSLAPAELARTETIVDCGLVYRPGEPVLIRVTRRERRVSANDNAAAIEKAARPPGWRAAADRIERDLDVNVSRQGAVWLPVVAVGPAVDATVRRIGEASLTLYEVLLDLEDPPGIKRQPPVRRRTCADPPPLPDLRG